MAPRPQRELVSIKLPEGFNAAVHEKALLKLIVEKHGTGFEIENINPVSGTATASRMVEINELSELDKTSDTIEVRLTRATKPGDGDKFAVKLESQHEGFYLTEFEPYLGYAILTRLTQATARARGAISTALGTKPWDVQIKQRPDGGYSLKLPRSFVVSKHEAKLQEVAETVVGKEGWYVQVDANALTAEIIPSDPPTFPDMIPYPMARLKKADLMRTPFGIKLGENGDDVADEAYIDWVAQAFALVAGTPGSGKTVTLNALIAGALASGSEVALGDDPSKSIDFLWMKDFVRPGGWGCADGAATVTMLSMVYDEGKRRAKYLEEKGVVNWLDLPEHERFKPILVIVDEVSALLVADKPPTGIPKDHVLYIEAAENALLAATMASLITKIVSQQRFVGVRMVLSTQVSNNNTGVGPTLKAKIGHKILQGANPSRVARTQAFNDETAVPSVPANIRASAKVAKGVGVAELEGSAPFIYKSYFATTGAYRAALEQIGVPKTSRPEPTPSEIAKHAPSTLEEDEPRSRMREEVGGFGRHESYVERADGLSGAAAAGHDLKVAAQARARADAGN
jgi:hypothetical protein